MKAIDIYKKLQLEGPFLVRVTDDTIADYEGYAEKGMVGRVVRAFPDAGYDELIEIHLDYTGFEDSNRLCESPDYKGGFSASEAGINTSRESVWLALDDDCLQPNEITQFDKFLESGSSLSYLAWLEKKVEDLEHKILSTGGDL